MEINERDYEFMLKVQETYEKNPNGEVSSIFPGQKSGKYSPPSASLSLK